MDLRGAKENSMAYPIAHLDLEAEEVKTLKSLGIRTTERLLEAAASPKGRRQLAERTGINEKRLLKFANTCDHMRIKGMGKGYVELLHEAGVDTVRELRYRKPANLAKAMAEANKKKKLVRFLPSEKLVVRWIEHAKELQLKITYKDRAEGDQHNGRRKLEM
jgi:predicted flap endonuclease-1-like 5' DNA nuclease